MAVTEVPIGDLEAIGKLGNVKGEDGSFFANTFTDTISRIIGVLTIIAGIWFLLQLIIGGIAWIQAGADKQGAENARKRLTNGFIGLLVTVLAYALLGVVGAFVGIDIINLNSAIVNIAPKP